MPSTGREWSCIMARKGCRKSYKALDSCVRERERLEEEDGSGHLFGFGSKKHSRLLPGGRLARKWTRLCDKFAIGRVTAIRYLENKTSNSWLA